MSKATFDKAISMMGTDSGRFNEIILYLKQVYGIASSNRNQLGVLERKNTKMVNDLRNEYEQLSRRNEFDIEEKVRQVMYESIKEHNISRN